MKRLLSLIFLIKNMADIVTEAVWSPFEFTTWTYTFWPFYWTYPTAQRNGSYLQDFWRTLCMGRRQRVPFFLWENPNPDFGIQKRILLFLGGKSKNESWIHKSTPWVDSSDQIQIRIFEIPNLSAFWEIVYKNIFLTSGFSNKNGICHLFTFVDDFVDCL